MPRSFGKGTMLLKMGLIMAMVAMVIVNPGWRAELQAQDESNGGQAQQGYGGLSCKTGYAVDRELCKFWRDYDNQTYEEYRYCIDDAIEELEDCVGIDPNDPNKNSWR